MIRQELIEYIRDDCLNEELKSTPIESLKFYMTTQTSSFRSVVYEPSICIALQGHKAVGFDGQTYGYSPQKYLLTCTNVPADIKIEEASPEKPFISVVLTFSLDEIYEVIKETNSKNDKTSKKVHTPFCFNTLDDTLLDPINRLVKLLDKPQETIDFMTPLIKKEIIYILLQNDEEFLKNYVMEGNLTNQIVKAIREIKDNFNETINIANLARKIGISEATLYQNFKKITAMSPLQYQKKIRLEEAQSMLLAQNLDASQVAFEVGYESPSQFSREYARMFGMPPKAHITHLKTSVA